MRVLRTDSDKSKEISYKSLVRPGTEYGATYWDPYRLEHIKTLEKIPKRALKCCRKNSPLKWDTLKDRRTRIQLCALFKTYRACTYTINSEPPGENEKLAYLMTSRPIPALQLPIRHVARIRKPSYDPYCKTALRSPSKPQSSSARTIIIITSSCSESHSAPHSTTRFRSTAQAAHPVSGRPHSSQLKNVLLGIEKTTPLPRRSAPLQQQIFVSNIQCSSNRGSHAGIHPLSTSARLLTRPRHEHWWKRGAFLRSWSPWFELCDQCWSQERRIFCGPLEKELRKRLVKCFVWSVALYGEGTWTLRRNEEKRIEAFEMWMWRRTVLVKWTDRIRNKIVFEKVSEKRMMLKLIRKIKSNWLGLWLKRIIDDIRICGSYAETKRKAENRKDWRLLGLQ
ncbi:hypothetical protein ANN_07951 [Periplaneta americana]|uniref:Uncharacterized protein n=1 Tax=Periplaneta americana TaxID=6978 RepID=A0ABQ8T0Q5_PERAM|nr:hypothetical protein ANN_07951 [Periplaneta americana]